MRVGLFIPSLDSPLTGVGRYVVEFTRALAALTDGPEIVLLTAGSLGPLANEGLRRSPLPGSPPAKLLMLGNRLISSLVSTRITLLTLGSCFVPVAARRLGLDIVHDLTNIPPYAFGAGGVRTVVTIHDVISWSHPGTNDWMDDLIQRYWLPRVVPPADAVITVSQTSKAEVVKHLKVPASRVRTVYHGVAPLYHPAAAHDIATIRARYGLPKGYILFVGSANERKNLHLLVDTWARLWREGERRSLVLVGPHSQKRAGIMEKLRRLDIEQHVIFTGYVPETDLPALYSGADLFVYPSSYEGFGLPPLEAMACGSAVVCSNASSLPEVVGDAALTVDPCDQEALLQAMQRLLTDVHLREEFRQRGLERASQFSWERAARETVDVYRKVCA